MPSTLHAIELVLMLALVMGIPLLGAIAYDGLMGRFSEEDSEWH